MYLCRNLYIPMQEISIKTMINIKKILLSAAFVALGGISVLATSKRKEPAVPAPSTIYWNDVYGKVYYSKNANVSPVVKIALNMFSDDMKAILGYPAKEKSNANIQIYQLDQLSNKEFSSIEKLGVPLHQFITQKDAFWIGTRQGKIIVVGSNARGTAYGIMELSSLAGVSPWTNYYHVAPLQKKTLSLAAGFESLQVPATTYRGLMLNDKAWMGRKNQSRLCRLMLRLRANTIWEGEKHGETSGKHETSTGKHDMNIDKQVTDSFDILVAENGKVTETVIGKKHNKKHKKSLVLTKLIWEDKQLSFSDLSPALMLNELGADSQDSGSRKGKTHKSHSSRSHEDEAWIADVNNPQAGAYQLSLFMEQAWNRNAATAANLAKHYEQWLSKLFGAAMGRKLMPLMKEYYRLTNIRPTGYMTMPFGEYEFHSGEFGNELERYLYDYDLLKTKATNVGNTLTAYQQQGFRNMILNPILIAALTAEKELEAQEARHIARPGLFSKDDEAKAAAALSLTAYQKLKAIEPSAQPPVLPSTMTAAEIRKSLQDAFDRSEDLKPFSYALIKDVIAKNAYQWTSATQSSIQLLPFTGHSTQAVSMNKGAILKYVVNTDMEGDARFTIGAIPDYTNQKGDMRISVMIDDQEPVTISLKDAYNHNNWKMDIWRGQTRKNFFTTLKKGNHVVEIKALDDHIILDQWILDFDVDREYYVIPVR